MLEVRFWAFWPKIKISNFLFFFSTKTFHFHIFCFGHFFKTHSSFFYHNNIIHKSNVIIPSGMNNFTNFLLGSKCATQRKPRNFAV